MSAFNSSIPSMLFGHNASVKAWCVTGNFTIPSGSQSQFDTTNFIDGFNLRLDYATQTSMTVPNWGGALKFSFLNPLPDNRYKVFVQVYGASSPLYPQLGHVLNSSQYPKTRDSFWVRAGFLVSIGTTPSLANYSRNRNQIHNIVLWSSAISSIGVVVI